MIVSRVSLSPPPDEHFSSVGSETPESGVRNRPPVAPFDVIYAERFAQVARWARAMGGSSADIEDLCQEIFMTVRRKLPEFDGANLPGWLYRITERAVRTHLRKAWIRRAFFLSSEEWRRVPERRPDPAEHLAAAQQRQAIERTLSRLSLKKRTALILSEVEGMTGEEIAEFEGVPVATIYSRLHYAKREFVELSRKESKA